MEYIELVQDCKLVCHGKVTKYDNWGNQYETSYQYVIINGKEKECFDNWYVIHDGKEIEDCLTKFLLDYRQREKEYLEKTGWRTPAEYYAYLKGREEIENNPELLQKAILNLRFRKLKKLKKNN
jgi:hypothetical protein